MAKTHNGVSWYTKGSVTLPVYFPEDMTTCQWCRFVRAEDSLKRHRCLLTWEYLPYPFTGRGNECPIIFEEGGSDRGDSGADHG